MGNLAKLSLKTTRGCDGAGVAERGYPTSKIRSSSFAGTAVKRYPTSKVRSHAVRTYPTSKVRSSGFALLEQP